MRQHLFFVGGQQSHFIDFPEIGLQGALNRVSAVSANPGHEESSSRPSKQVHSNQDIPKGVPALTPHPTHRPESGIDALNATAAPIPINSRVSATTLTPLTTS
jgi:hypothetical protein